MRPEKGRFMFYFITIKTNHNHNVLNNKEVFDIIKYSIFHYGKGYRVLTIGFVVMPDHLHWLFYQKYNLPITTLVKNIKGFSANKILSFYKHSHDDILEMFLLRKYKKRNHFFRLWQTRYHVRMFDNNEELENKVRYMINNPVKTGLVDSTDKYKFMYIREGSLTPTDTQ